MHSLYNTSASSSGKLWLTSLQCGSILKSLTNSKSLKQGQTLHAYIISSGIIQDNTYITTKLAAFYASCGYMEKAQCLFDHISHKSSFLWNFMIRGYVSNGLSAKAILLYQQMMNARVVPDNFTYPFVVKACGEMLDVELGKRVHAVVLICGFESDVYVGNCLLSMYAKFGDMQNACLVFDRMFNRDLTSWNTMMSGYARNGCFKEAMCCFQDMQRSGSFADSTSLLGLLSACCGLKAFERGKEVHGYILRNVMYVASTSLRNSLIDFYCGCNAVVYGRRLFDVSPKDSVTWNAMISGYARNGVDLESLRLFCRMVAEGDEPDLATLVAVLEACENVAALDFGISVHSYLVRKGFGSYTMTATSLISMYSQCGQLSCSRRVFDELEEKNLVCWTALISAYGYHGNGGEAVSIFHQMAEYGIVPDEVTFTSILTACSHAGLVEQGREIFRQLQKRHHSVKPTLAHYACLVDILSRAGQLEEAYEVICNMVVTPTVDIWAALLSGCRLHGDVTLAEVAGQKILEMNPERVGGYISLSHIYADDERWNDVEKMRDMLQSKRLAKPTGYSFVK